MSTGWSSINISDVPTGMELLPAGEYTFQVLPGAKFSDNDPGRVEASLAVAGGEHTGRRVFISYPDPAKKEWSPSVFKRLVEALGLDIETGESPTAYLNRAAGLRVVFNVKHEKDNEGVDRVRTDIFKPKPAQN